MRNLGGIVPQRFKKISTGTDQVVVAGPGSDRTIPGLLTSEVVEAMTSFATVTRLEIDPVRHFHVGLHRATALAARHEYHGQRVTTWRVETRRRSTKLFARHFTEETTLAVAVSWPTMATDWIGDFLSAAKKRNIPSLVLVVAGPTSPSSRIAALARDVVDADLVLVGDPFEANLLSALLRSPRPVIETHRALALMGRHEESSTQVVTAFVRPDDRDAIATIIAAFDGTPQSFASRYRFQIVTREGSPAVEELVSQSFYRDQIDVITKDFSTAELGAFCRESSAILIADPSFDSRAYATAELSGVATVVITDEEHPAVGRGYIGGLVADRTRPASVYVAMAHALRLASLNFPTPEMWSELGLRARLMTQPAPVLQDSDVSTSFAL